MLKNVQCLKKKKKIQDNYGLEIVDLVLHTGLFQQKYGASGFVTVYRWLDFGLPYL